MERKCLNKELQKRMGCGATWVSLQGWGGRGKLGFPTIKK